MYGRTIVGQSENISMQSLCADASCSLDDLQEVMDDRVKVILCVIKTWWRLFNQVLYTFDEIMINKTNQYQYQ